MNMPFPDHLWITISIIILDKISGFDITKELSEDLFNLLILQLALFPCVVIDETAPISYPEISTVVPLLLDAVRLYQLSSL